MQILVRDGEGIAPRRGRLDDLAFKLAQAGWSRAVAPVDRHGVCTARAQVGELALERDHVSLVDVSMRQAQVGSGEMWCDFVDGDARRRIPNLAILVCRR